ncbi:aminopeptidase P family protein [Cellulomonas carbonis]|uniref:Xaa-Pro aminopeptidase n=1 Tax=Cellulomonas carbonis T26 TaxID=947969 RepID=A0A0A0BPR4_9CELL|nr:aminopeptidase P family protein [Cellulomonas carbonis]KGM09950.1 Xaa-Pro aminopeptidase [Cellulomonas carbonis T26]GGC16645.1 Xaa-Pro aminopeptidase [Cellulomonas carbonis]
MDDTTTQPSAADPALAPAPPTAEQPVDTAGTDGGQALEDRGSNRSQRPTSRAFLEFVTDGWADRPVVVREPLPAAPFAAERRRRIGAQFPGERLVVPAGPLRTRSNDTDYRFRPHSAFAHLTGLGTDQEPDAVLVLHPTDDGGHEAVLYFRPLAGRDSEEFFADSRYGEFWVGARPTLDDLAVLTGIRTAPLDELADALGKDVGEGGVRVRVVRGADDAVTHAVEDVRSGADLADEDVARADAELAEALSELRLVKDEHEVEQMRAAVAATVAGFERIVANLPRAVAHRRGERVIEATFDGHAREEGNAVGYETIAASGEHATTLHWIRNDGEVRAGDLVLVDAGVEVESLYTADVTRTLPVDGAFTEVQRRVYQAVLDAADAAFAVARPGTRFRDVHAAAMEVIAARLEEWGLLPCSAAESLDPEGQYHRRWMVHGTSHHLGLDVHDCAQARRELYLDAELEPGMVFTIEPGLYFKADDLAVPEEYRGIGVRIEDDVLVTADGHENLSAALPRRPDDVEEWMARLLPR